MFCLSGARISSIFLLLIIACAAVTADAESRIEPEDDRFCNEQNCRLPDCRCSFWPLPKSEFAGKENEIPQFISVTFDDAVNVINFAQYQKVFNDLINPDGCAARGTFFVSHEYSDYSRIHDLYSDGHEIALHSITHSYGTDYWREADIDRIVGEFGQQIDMLEAYAKVNRKDIKGMRLPFLQLAGNSSFEAAKRLGLLYDSSWPTQQFIDPAMWPYTLDYPSVQDCQIGPCPKASVPGLWISPMVSWSDGKGYSCAMLDGCVYPPKDDEQSVFEWILRNFNRHYKGNRAPFGMYLHSAWFSRGKNYFAGFRKFLEYANTLPNVYIVPIARVIEYVRQPVLGSPFTSCPEPDKEICVPRTCPLRKDKSREMRYMTVCNSCPRIYPWLGNPLGSNLK